MAESGPTHAEPATIIVAVADRETRRAWSQAALEAGYFVRAATRPAEVAKAQADGTARLLIRRDHQDDAVIAMSARVPTLTVPSALPTRELPTYIRKALADQASAS